MCEGIERVAEGAARSTHFLREGGAIRGPTIRSDCRVEEPLRVGPSLGPGTSGEQRAGSPSSLSRESSDITVEALFAYSSHNERMGEEGIHVLAANRCHADRDHSRANGGKQGAW